MRLSAYAYDIGPSQNIAFVATEALKQQHRVAFVGNDKLAGHDMFAGEPDVLLTGLSSRQEFGGEEELALGATAKGRDIPWVILADTHRSWGRQFARGRIENATLLVAAPAEADQAREFGYADVKYVGGPPLWQGYSTIKPAKVERMDPENKLIMVVGNKDARVIDGMCEKVITACREIFGDKWELIFKPHPNENPDTSVPERRAEILSRARVINTTERTTNLIGTVDCPIFYPGATDSVATAYMRKPAVCYEDHLSLAQLEDATGVRTWYPSESGACVKATSANIAEAIGMVLSPSEFEGLVNKQESAYPIGDLTCGSVESRIVKFMAGLAG